MSPQSKMLSLVVVGLALFAGIGTALFWRHRAEPHELTDGTYVSPRRALPDFSLIDAHGRGFGPRNLRGAWTIMFFGYTNCPDFCPATLATLAALEKKLRTEGAAVRPRVVFMSVDARRDTPAQLAQYVPYFDPEFIGVTAVDQATVAAVAAKLGITVILTPQPGGGYTVDHSAEVFVIDPEARLAAILTGPFTVATLQTDFARIVAGPV